MGQLTNRFVQTAGVGRHCDGEGLHLVVSPSGTRRWVFRYQVRAVRRDMGLGSYPDVGLADARDLTAEARRRIKRGQDPIEARKADNRAKKPIPTFGEIAQLVIAEAQKRSGNDKVRYQWARHLGPAYCGPLLSRPVNEITTIDVAAILRPIWQSKPEVARKLYPAIRRVFEYARIRLRDDHGVSMPDNPARWDDLKAIGFEPPRKLSKGRHPSLAHDQLPAFMTDLGARDAIAARALEFLILTNVRTDAVLKARWEEIDLGEAVWTVPLTNLKDRKHRKEGFRAPLSDRAVDIVLLMTEMRTSDFVFPAHRADRPLSNMAMLSLLKRMNCGSAPKWVDPTSKRPITAHGFRATFRTWVEEATGFPHAVAEEAMGHKVGTQVERAYRRTDVLEKRRELMQAWANQCAPVESAKVFQLRQKA